MSEKTENLDCIQCKKTFIRIIRSGGKQKLCSDCSKQKRLARVKAYKARNKTYISDYNSRYKSENKNEISKYNKKYNRENRANIQAQQTKQHKIRRHTDLQYKMSVVMRNRIGKIFRKKSEHSSKKLLGCSYEDFIKWMEFQFYDEMTLENHGIYWHIDHVIPCALFNLTKDEDQIRCCHWTNMRPLLSSDNMSRQDSCDYEEISIHECVIDKFLDKYKEEISDMYNLDYDRNVYLD